MVALTFIVVGIIACGLGVWFWRKSLNEGEPEQEDWFSSSESISSHERTDSDFRNIVGRQLKDEIPPWEIPSSYESASIRSDSVSKFYAGCLYADSPIELRKNVEEVLTASGSMLPTSAQWDMILSPERATRVIAGAGSGKSTALSLRVVVLHKFMGISLDQITVVTFTRASRSDMAEKLIRDMAVFGVVISSDIAKRVVRTFHSLIIEQAASGLAKNRDFFEQMGDKAENGSDTDSLGTLNSKQLSYLRQLYASLYRDNMKFNKAIGQVLLEKISAPRQIQYSELDGLDRAIVVAEPRDRVVTQAITDAWMAKPGFDPKADTIEWNPTAIKTSRSGGIWYTNGRVIATGMPVILGCGGIKDAARNVLDRSRYSIGEGDKDRTLGFIGNVRLKVVASIAIEKYLYIETDEDLSDLYTLIDWVYRGRLPGDRDTFPAFSLRLPGDNSSTSIFECLYNVGTFVASMGMEVSSSAETISSFMKKDKLHLEAHLCTALAEFWPALHKTSTSYDELFLQHGRAEYISTVPQHLLLPMKHLLIDEFQDISGQIVQWIKAVHSALVEQGEEPSLLAVGDDWQSVYGWRGSDPDFMVQFDRHFGESKLIVMNENFRSGQHIINTAEKLVGHLTSAASLHKHGVASGSAAKALGDVELCTGGDEEISKLVLDLRANNPSQAVSVFILSRTNEGLVPFRKLAKDRLVSLMTMHRAKGLEADYVIIKGDCFYANSSPLRNAVYALAGMRTTYDAAQDDEALRVAYVSLTRAKSKAYWFADNAKPGGAFSRLTAVC